EGRAGCGREGEGGGGGAAEDGGREALGVLGERPADPRGAPPRRESREARARRRRDGGRAQRARADDRSARARVRPLALGGRGAAARSALARPARALRARPAGRRAVRFLGRALTTRL